MSDPGTQGPGPDFLPLALQVLTFVTGLVDAVSFLALDRVFTANMTGNLVLLGFAVGGAPGLSVGRSLTALLLFLVGAVLGGRLGVAMAGARRAWLITVAVSEAVLLFAAALVSLGLDGPAASSARLYAVIVLTALAMGARNATVRRLGAPDLSTTVLTSTLAAVASESSLAGGRNPRLGARLGAVASMFAGAAVGTVLLRLGPAVPLAVSGACVLAAMLSYAVWPSRRRSTTAS